MFLVMKMNAGVSVPVRAYETFELASSGAASNMRTDLELSKPQYGSLKQELWFYRIVELDYTSVADEEESAKRHEELMRKIQESREVHQAI